MDTSKAQGELGWLLDPPEDGWSEGQQILNGTPLYMYQDCPVQESRDTDHWLRSSWIYRGEEASRVHVELQFTVRDCKSFPGEAGPLGCKETFNLLYMESDQDVGIQLRRPLFQKVTTVAADQSFTIRDLASGAVKLNVERCSLGHLTRRGLYLAFHNPGACVALVSVRVFYQRCPETVHGLAQFPNTLPGPGGLAEVAGTCLPHAHVTPGPSGAPRMHCSPDGQWLVPVGRCHCEPGYEEGSSGGVEGCLACPKGSYRADVDTPSCLKCPRHSTAESEGATVCTCESGHYRVPGEGPAAACTRPPSVPRNLSFSVSGTQLSLRWEPPVDLGGREDVRYDVGCSQCREAALDGEPCQPCGGSVRFSPGPSGLTTAAVCVDGLEPDANYTFNVEAQNGVSELGASKPASASLSINMGHAVTLSGLSLRLVKKAPRQLELTWAASRPRSPRGNLSYELHVLNQDEERYQMVLEPRVLLTELQPDTTYTVRVRTMTPLGPGPFSPDHEFRTSPPGKLSGDGTRGGRGSVIVSLMGTESPGGSVQSPVRCRCHCTGTRAPGKPSSSSLAGSDKLWLKPYVDLQAYEDPAQGALDFTQELNPAWLVVDTVMKSIEDGYRLPPPVDCPARLYELMKNCWAHDCAHRPPFHQLKAQLEHLHANPHSLRTIANFDPRSVSAAGLSACPLLLPGNRPGSGFTDNGRANPQSLDNLCAQTANLNAACRCTEAERRFQESPASPCMGLRQPMSHRVTLRLPSLSGSDGIPYRSVAEWLESIRMKRYILHFHSAGLDTMECVLDLTAEDLAQMGITQPAHQKRILCSIQGFKD
ncbi:hypothetical protein EI555_014324 [Monodon monoceros]|uniref:receptor protein-tyrosine kinase n=1 Tax=Monodon monoceros TaxID=40151 RepID=A0A4V5PB36_MONMO|nr:hypothetical protein EI555_014324 [Monodon monoceros]